MDETTGIEYDSVSSIGVSEGHTYKYIPEKMYVGITTTNTLDGKKLVQMLRVAHMIINISL